MRLGTAVGSERSVNPPAAPCSRQSLDIYAGTRALRAHACFTFVGCLRSGRSPTYMRGAEGKREREQNRETEREIPREIADRKEAKGLAKIGREEDCIGFVHCMGYGCGYA